MADEFGGAPVAPDEFGGHPIHGEDDPGFLERFFSHVNPGSLISAYGHALASVGNPALAPAEAVRAGSEAIMNGAGPVAATLAAIPGIGETSEDIRKGNYGAALGGVLGTGVLGAAVGAGYNNPEAVSSIASRVAQVAPDVAKAAGKATLGTILEASPLRVPGGGYASYRLFRSAAGDLKNAFSPDEIKPVVAGAPKSPGQLLAESSGQEWQKLSPENRALLETIAQGQANAAVQPAATPRGTTGGSPPTVPIQPIQPVVGTSAAAGGPIQTFVPGGGAPLRPPLATPPAAAPAPAPVPQPEPAPAPPAEAAFPAPLKPGTRATPLTEETAGGLLPRMQKLLEKMGKPADPEDAAAVEDLSDLLQKSIDAAKKAKGQKTNVTDLMK